MKYTLGKSLKLIKKSMKNLFEKNNIEEKNKFGEAVEFTKRLWEEYRENNSSKKEEIRKKCHVCAQRLGSKEGVGRKSFPVFPSNYEGECPLCGGMINSVLRRITPEDEIDIDEYDDAITLVKDLWKSYKEKNGETKSHEGIRCSNCNGKLIARGLPIIFLPPDYKGKCPLCEEESGLERSSSSF